MPRIKTLLLIAASTFAFACGGLESAEQHEVPAYDTGASEIEVGKRVPKIVIRPVCIDITGIEIKSANCPAITCSDGSISVPLEMCERSCAVDRVYRPGEGCVTASVECGAWDCPTCPTSC